MSNAIHNFTYRLSCALRQTPKEWMRWRNSSDTAKNIRVYYGYDRVPLRTEIASGGIIKCQDLNDRFPNTTRGGNLLYLISSAIPVGYEPMVHFARKAGVKFVLNQNGVGYPAWYGPGWEAFNTPIRRLLRHADFIVYQSQFCKTTADKFIGPISTPCTTLHNPVDTSYFSPATPQRELAPDSPILLAAGSHMQFYRVNQALETLYNLRLNTGHGRLILAGRFCWKSDPAVAETEVHESITRLGIAPFVMRVGPYSQSQAVPLLRSADILLHTKYNDPCPRLVVEALSCGLPVVYSASGGVPELVGDQAGIGIPSPLDYEQLHPPCAMAMAKAVANIWSDYTTYSQAARERAVSQFDTKLWMNRHEEIFNRLIS